MTTLSSLSGGGAAKQAREVSNKDYTPPPVRPPHRDGEDEPQSAPRINIHSAKPATVNPRLDRGEAEALILAALRQATKPITAKEVMAATKVSKSSVKTVMTRLVNHKKLVHKRLDRDEHGTVCKYWLPDVITPTDADFATQELPVVVKKAPAVVEVAAKPAPNSIKPTSFESTVEAALEDLQKRLRPTRVEHADRIAAHLRGIAQSLADLGCDTLMIEDVRQAADFIDGGDER